MQTYTTLYLNFLEQLKSEISSYKNESDVWKLEGSISNTPGNLCLHICGNLKHFFGAIVDKTGYVRERDLEFSRKNVSREELIREVDETIDMIKTTFGKLTLQNINDIYPEDKFGKNVTMGFTMLRLISHMAYHIGQINYHRRIIEG